MKKQALIGTIMILMFWWALATGQGFLYFADTLVEHFALQSFLKTSLLLGQDIAWNPFIGLGAPSLAEGHMGAYSPLNWIYLLFSDQARVMGFIFLFHLGLAWMGMATVARFLRMSFESQSLACLIFVLGGYVTAFSTNHVYILAVCQMPWMIWAALRFNDNPRKSTALVLATLMALHFFTGAFPIFFITSVCVLIISFWGGLNSTVTWKSRGFYFLLATVVSMLLAAAQLLPTLELIYQSHFLHGKSIEYLTENSLSGKLLLSFFFPHIWGFINAPETFLKLSFLEQTQDYFDYDELHNYVGLLPLIVFFVGLFYLPAYALDCPKPSGLKYAY
jgi:hypothetical protein